MVLAAVRTRYVWETAIGQVQLYRLAVQHAGSR